MARRRKQNSGDIVVGVIALAFALAMVNGISPKALIGSLVWAVAIVLGVALVFLFVKGQSNSRAPSQTKSAKPLSKQSARSKHDAAIIATLADESKPAPKKWTIELINQLEWRVFEKLCVRLWEEKGFSAKETNAGADGGVDFYLYATSTKQKIGAVQCKSWGKKQIGVNVLRELQGVVAAEQLKLGLLMYSGELSKAAKEFLALTTVSIKSQGSAAILLEIEKLDTNPQQALLSEIASGDYMTPSCPNCDVKLVERTAKKTGKVFMGCVNFPRCRYTI